MKTETTNTTTDDFNYERVYSKLRQAYRDAFNRADRIEDFEEWKAASHECRAAADRWRGLRAAKGLGDFLQSAHAAHVAKERRLDREARRWAAATVPFHTYIVARANNQRLVMTQTRPGTRRLIAVDDAEGGGTRKVGVNFHVEDGHIKDVYADLGLPKFWVKALAKRFQ